MNALRDALLALIASALLGFDTMTASAVNVLTNGLDTWDLIVELSDVLKPFCYVVIGICLLIELVQVSSKVDMIKWEYGLKICVKMVLAKVLIDSAPVFLEACYLQASKWVSDVVNAPLGGVSNLGELVNDEMSVLVNAIGGLWSVLGLFISVFIVVMAIKLCGLIVQVIAYGRMFELYVYLAVSPLPCAFFPLGNGDGGGFSPVTSKFFKSFTAICLQGVMMVLCMRIFGVVMENTIRAGISDATSTTGTVAVSDLCYTMLLGSIVLVMSVVKCGSWAKAILDAT